MHFLWRKEKETLFKKQKNIGQRGIALEALSMS
jgi:hypothetical protein